jgi:hypothetical protein
MAGCLMRAFMSSRFFESVSGLAFLHRLVLALHVVFVEIGTCGMRLVCLMLEMTRLIGLRRLLRHRLYLEWRRMFLACPLRVWLIRCEMRPQRGASIMKKSRWITFQRLFFCGTLHLFQPAYRWHSVRKRCRHSEVCLASVLNWRGKGTAQH